MLDFNDGLWLRIRGTSNITSGFIVAMNFRLSKTDTFAYFDIIDDPDWMIYTIFQKANL
ncbi:hypothetical protein HXY32_00560 [Candidatus Bathyarchaeota archaeon]|nr:hypothetical protein [Candidatus Bathyarchaeota archaeon]